MAQGDILIAEGTVWKVNGEADADYAWSVEGISDGNGRVSARIDLGAAPRGHLLRWRGQYKTQSSPTQGNALKIYVSASDGTYEDGNVGTSDAALSDSDVLRNLTQVGQIIADEADTTNMISGGVFSCYERYLSLVAWNDTGAAINATDSNFIFFLTLLKDQYQTS
jgi:hypothetical protein